MEYLLKLFWHSITVVLKKLQKLDYTLPKAYRPIVLLNTISKVLKVIVARRILKEVEERKLFLKT